MGSRKVAKLVYNRVSGLRAHHADSDLAWVTVEQSGAAVRFLSCEETASVDETALAVCGHA
jgi:hypothetical protein